MTTLEQTPQGFALRAASDAVIRPHTDPAPTHLDRMLAVLDAVVARDASDLHLTVGAPPTVREHGLLTALDNQPRLDAAETEQMICSILTPAQLSGLQETNELDFAYTRHDRTRFRVNVYRQRGSLGAAFRLIPRRIRSLSELGLPPVVPTFAGLPRGLVLVTGPTGSGKSTTLASLLDVANRTRSAHILTIEDPIEYLHEHVSCIVNQREVGADTGSFAEALKRGLRQDPDIILVGELRDLETTSVALTAAETGHLVLATLHTQDAAQTVDRLIDIFPPHQQQQIRTQVAATLRGVVCQTLLPTSDGAGRALAAEVMVATPAIRALIREGRTHQLESVMQTGGAVGMVTFDASLAELVEAKKVSYHTAFDLAHDTATFSRMAGRT